MVYEAELVGLMLAAELLQQLDFLEDDSITINNQVAVKVITSFYSTPGEQLIDFFIDQMTELTKQHKGVPFEVYDILGHQGILGNEDADNPAKQVAK